MRKHAFSIGLAVVILGLILGLTSLRAAPTSVAPGVPATVNHYRLHMDSLGKFLLLDTTSGQVWEYNIDRRPNRWTRIPMPPGLEGETAAAVEKTSGPE